MFEQAHLAIGVYFQSPRPQAPLPTALKVALSEYVDSAVRSMVSCNQPWSCQPAVGTIGCLQALEVIKLLAAGSLLPITMLACQAVTITVVHGVEDAATSFAGRLLMFDGLRGTFRNIKLRPRNPACCLCGDTPTQQ
jgi:molybdopterin/thiamine biosynthesis adenylyltransferase